MQLDSTMADTEAAIPHEEDLKKENGEEAITIDDDMEEGELTESEDEAQNEPSENPPASAPVEQDQNKVENKENEKKSSSKSA